MYAGPPVWTTQGYAGSAWDVQAWPPRVPDPADRPPPPDERRQWAHMVAQRLKTGVESGRLRLPRWFDPAGGDSAAFRRERRKMLAEPMVKAPALGKALAVAQLDLQTHPRDPDDARQVEAAAFVKDALDESGAYDLILGLCLGASMDGWALGEPVWAEAPAGRWAGKWAWQQVKWKDTDRLTLELDPYRTVTGVTAQDDGATWSPEDFLIATNLPLFENPYGISDWLAAYRAWWLKTVAWELRLSGLERWAAPFLVGTYDPALVPKRELDEALTHAGSNAWLSVPNGAVVEAVSVANSGESDFKSAIADLNDEMVVAIAGATLTILTSQQSDPRGSSAVQKSTTQLFQWAQAAGVQTVLSKQASPLLTRKNFWGVPPPRVTLGAVDEAELAARLQNDTGLQALGLPLSKQEAYAYYGRQPPKGPGDTLGGSGPAGGNGNGGARGGPPGGAPAFSDRDGRRLRRLWRAYCQSGRNKGMPGPCPRDGAGAATGPAPKPSAAAAPAKSAPEARDELDRVAGKSRAVPPPFPVDEAPPYKGSASIPADERAAAPLAEIPADRLTATQADVSVAAVARKIDAYDPADDAQAPLVVRTGDKYYLDDGTHQASAAKFRGVKSIRARLFDYEPGADRPRPARQV